MIFIVSIVVVQQGREQQHARAPHLNPNSLVKVSAFDKSGKVLRVQQGVLVSDDGYIESNLTPLAGASKIKVTFRDGRTREIDKIWADDESNLAVMRVEDAEQADGTVVQELQKGYAVRGRIIRPSMVKVVSN